MIPSIHYVGVAAMFSCVSSSAVSVGAEPTLVNTSTGFVRGVLNGRTRAFLGIPYGTAERWQPPKPPPKWDGIRNATSAGLSCEVPLTVHAAQRAVYTHIRTRTLHAHAHCTHTTRTRARARTHIHTVHPQEAEDCLFVNVVTPWPLPDGAGLPVLLFIHGGQGR
jgi:carboxylesterase type B